MKKIKTNDVTKRVQFFKNIQVALEKRIKRSTEKTPTKILKTSEETAPPSFADEIKDEDSLKLLVMKQKKFANEILAVHVEPKKHIGGRVRGGVVNFDEALQITVPYE